MKKTKKTHLTDEVRDALIALKNIPWDQFPLERVGYAPQNYPGVRRVLMNSILNIEMVAKYMIMLDAETVETDHIKLSVQYYSGNVEDVENATFNLKTNLANMKPTGVTWRELAIEYGYTDTAGTFSRAMKHRKWAPVEMMYMIAKKFEVTKVAGESNGMKITFEVKK